MNNSPLANSLSVSVRIYRALLVAYPKKFREHYETQMVQVFRDSFREAYHHQGMLGMIDLWLNTIVDLVFTVLHERISERSQYMFSPRIIVWAGVASAFGGLMWLFIVLTGQGATITSLLALLLMLAGMTALHARQGKQAGILGASGFVLGILGTGLLVSLFMWNMISGNSLESENNSIASLQFAQLALGMNMLGIGYILIGIRTLQTKVLSRTTTVLSILLGVSYAGLGSSIWLAYYYLISNGINPWNPMTVPIVVALLTMFAIGILWIVLGVILAQNPGWETSNPPASA